MTKNRQIATLFLLMMLLFSSAPLFVFAAEDATNQIEDAAKAKPDKFTIALRAKRMLEIANRTAMRIEYFIEKIYENKTLIEMLENAGLLNDEGNITLFINATNLLGQASAAMNSSDYESVIANVTEAMKTFREAYRALHNVLEKHMAALRNRGIPWGLIVAMQRTLERIERIRTLSINDENIMILLDEAKLYLNVTAKPISFLGRKLER